MIVALMLGLAALPTITIDQTTEGYVAKIATFDVRQQAEVDAEIDRRAASVCADRDIYWGKFRSLTKIGKNPRAEPAPVTGYIKQFSCVAREQASYPAPPSDWKATSADERDAVAVLNSYYARRDRGDFMGALAMFEPGVLGDLASWSAEQAATNKKIGKGSRRVTGVTWYVNPDTAPHPGIYVAIDFVGDFPSTYFYCGYLALYRRGPGSYEITREEQNMFTHGDGNPDPAQLEQMRGAMCRG
jgi:hypothetical protein